MQAIARGRLQGQEQPAREAGERPYDRLNRTLDALRADGVGQAAVLAQRDC